MDCLEHRQSRLVASQQGSTVTQRPPLSGHQSSLEGVWAPLANQSVDETGEQGRGSAQTVIAHALDPNPNTNFSPRVMANPDLFLTSKLRPSPFNFMITLRGPEKMSPACWLRTSIMGQTKSTPGL